MLNRKHAAKAHILKLMSQGYRLRFLPMPDGTEIMHMTPPGIYVDETLGREYRLTEKGRKAVEILDDKA